MAITRVSLDKDNTVEGYEQGADRNSDAADLRGVYLQNDTSNDTNVLVSRDAANNLTLADPVAGTRTLAELIRYYEFLLDNEPTAETGATDAAYSTTYSGNNITNETWKRNDTTNIKTIDYTYTGNRVTTEVRKVFAADGTTIVAEVTWSYTYTGNNLTSATMIRNV